MAESFDVIVIGMGVSGEEVAGRTSAAGMKVLVVERRLIGGECAYWGCVPSKTMIRAADSVAEALRGTKLAGSFDVAPSWDPVAARVREVTGEWDDAVAIERYEKKGAVVKKAAARIVGPREVEIDGDRYSASKGIVIATGSEPAAPPIDGLDGVRYWTNRDAIEAREVPDSLAVLGAGAVGVELAQVYARFGAAVTIVEVGDHALPAEEPENGAALGRVLEEDGIALHTGVSAQSVAATGDRISIALSDGTRIESERLLVATGRRSILSDLGVDTVGVDPDAHSIDVDDHMRAGDGLWAVGDVVGKGAFTHIAVYQGRIAAADIMGAEHSPADYSAVPRVTFTDPEIASVGMTEAQAEKQGIDVKTASSPTRSSSRGWIHGPGAEHGVFKLVADAERGILVGASLMGPAAGEILGLLILAVKERIPVRRLRDLIYPYPTFVRGLEDPLREIGG